MALLREKLGLQAEDTQRMRQSLDYSYERQNTFVSSWCQRRTESSGLWPAYADRGRGIALKSSVAKILGATWRAPIDLFGPTARNEITGLMLRDVKYLAFDDNDAIPSIDDLHLPLLKRETFSDEHEIRLLAFTEHAIATPGFSLNCNLHEVITEIVVGPNAEFETTCAEINESAPELLGIPITKSALTH